MKPYSSSTLKILSKHCPAALGFHEAGAIWNSAWNMAPGTAAHAIAQMVGEFAKANGRPADASEIEHVASTTCESLLSTGRTFRCQHEPPMSPDDAFAGRDIILPWLLDNPLSPDALYEHELWLEHGNYSAIFDLHEVREEGDEESSYTVAESWDYKSAWPTGEAELDTFQLRGHAVLLWENYPAADVIRYGVINLRTRQRYSRELYRGDDEHRQLIARWDDDIFIAVRAAQENREARPGAGCIGCPFSYKCTDAWNAARAPAVISTYVMAKGYLDHFAPLARKLCEEEGRQCIEGGEVGYIAKDGRKPIDGASKALAHEVFAVAPGDVPEWDADNAMLLGLLAKMDPGLTVIEKVAKWLLPGRENKPARDDMIERLVEPTIKTEFKVVRGKVVRGVEFLLEGEE